MVLVLLAWVSAANSGASATEAIGGGLQIWLVGHLSRLTVPGGQFGLPPLGLTLLPAVLLFTSAARAARAAHVRGRRGVVSLTATIAASYAVVAGVVALLARSDTVRPLPVTAFLGAAAVAVLAGGAGAVRGSGRTRAWQSRAPVLARVAATGAAGALAAISSAGALLVALMLLRHRHAASELFQGIGGGAAATLLVALICLLYVPTAVVWGSAWLLGPGFAVGAGTSVAVTGTQLGAVPAVPLLAALPGAGPGGPGWAVVVLAVAGAGSVAGLLVDRAVRREAAGLTGSWRDLGLLSAATGGLTGLGVAVLALLAAGPAGPGRLAHTGPTAWVVAPVAALEVAVAVLAVLAVQRLRTTRREAHAGH
jgi:hypothetical protein